MWLVSTNTLSFVSLSFMLQKRYTGTTRHTHRSYTLWGANKGDPARHEGTKAWNPSPSKPTPRCKLHRKLDCELHEHLVISSLPQNTSETSGKFEFESIVFSQIRDACSSTFFCNTPPFASRICFTIRAGGVTRAKSWQQLPLAKLIHILHSLRAQIRLIHWIDKRACTKSMHDSCCNFSSYVLKYHSPGNLLGRSRMFNVPLHALQL